MTVLMNAQNTFFRLMGTKIFTIYAKKVSLSGHMPAAFVISTLRINL